MEKFTAIILVTILVSLICWMGLNEDRLDEYYLLQEREVIPIKGDIEELTILFKDIETDIEFESRFDNYLEYSKCLKQRGKVGKVKMRKVDLEENSQMLGEKYFLAMLLVLTIFGILLFLVCHIYNT